MPQVHRLPAASPGRQGCVYSQSVSAQPETHESEWTLARLLSWTADYLSRHGVEESRLASEVLLAHTLARPRIDLYTRFDLVPSGETLARFRALVKRAATHEPIAYLVGEREFFSLAFTVTRDVLIPRPETETLVEVALDHCRSAGLASPRVLDVGTGSGCIAIAILKQLAGAVAVATDNSAAALKVAAGNAERHGVADRFRVVEADGLALPAEVVPAGGFDLMVCNPPYISADQIDGLDAAVREFEPRSALTDGGDGLSFYRSIGVDAPPLVGLDGVIIVEVADGQGQSVVETMCGQGVWAPHGSRRDRVVGAERVLVFSRPQAP